jgi:hypothetical protein
MSSSHDAVLARIEDLYRMLFSHSGYGEMSVEIRFLRKREKEVLIRCGKQYRFVVPYDGDMGAEAPLKRGRRASAGTEGTGA